MARDVGRGWGYTPPMSSCPVCPHLTLHTHARHTRAAGLTNPDAVESMTLLSKPHSDRGTPEGSRDRGDRHSTTRPHARQHTGTGKAPEGDVPSPAPKRGAGNGQVGHLGEPSGVALLTADRASAPGSPTTWPPTFPGPTGGGVAQTRGLARAAVSPTRAALRLHLDQSDCRPLLLHGGRGPRSLVSEHRPRGYPTFSAKRLEPGN